MDHRTTEAASAPIVQETLADAWAKAVCQSAPPARPWPVYRNRRWLQRMAEAWWVLTGKWSLHRAWQSGNLKILSVAGLIFAAIIGGICLEISFWNECRQSNSFFYCMRVLGK